ncbi:MAG TPA: beta-galactosidase [Solirubrobacterales bacterium]|nr:beta-galactosidase [Solirubrobacterales bacterium]
MKKVPTIHARAGRSAWGLFALVAVTAATGLLSATAQAAPHTFYGLVPNSDLRAADYRLMQKANVGSARVSLFWHVIEARKNQFDWGATDAVIGALAASNIQALPSLFGTPKWLAKDPTKPPVGSKRQRAEWSEFIGEAVRRYGNGGTYWSSVYPTQHPGETPLPIAAWQVWNEVNGPKHFHPRPDVGKYAQLLKITSEAIKRGDRSAEIVTSGLVSKPTGKGGIEGWNYLTKLLKEKGAKRSLDHAALHPYAVDERRLFKDVKKMRRALKKGGKKKGQTWITEVGWSSDRKGKGKLAKSPTEQATLLKKTYTQLARKRTSWKVGGVYWYTWRDSRGPRVCDWCPTAGLVKRNLKPKPAFNQYRKLAR